MVSKHNVAQDSGLVVWEGAAGYKGGNNSSVKRTRYDRTGRLYSLYRSGVTSRQHT